ncbi:MAG: hypothetical protein KTR32_41635 [Granulosicoccus sp.]|nr:hypothetical protein [Granulosicoccus sp.]
MDTPQWMKSADEQRSSRSLSRQSLARPLSELEQTFATALETIFIDGCHDMDEVAARLSQQGVVAPNSGSSSWTADLLNTELTEINRQLDQAYQEHGFGA